MKFKERPDSRVREKGSKQNRYESSRTTDEHGRQELKLPKPKGSPVVGMICIYCGRFFPSKNDDELTCAACSNPAVGP